MASAVLLQSLGNGVIQDANGNAESGRLIYVYARGTNTQVTVYNDAGLTTPLTQPLESGAWTIPGQSTPTPGAIPGYVLGEQSLDFVDSASGNRTWAEPVSAQDVGTGGSLAVGEAVSGASNNALLVTNGSGELESGGPTASAVTASSSGGIPAWAASTAYGLNQLVTNGGNTYICLVAHTSGSTFSGESGDWQQVGGSGGGSSTISSTGTAGAPTSGTWTTDQLAFDSGNRLWLCTSGGTPGTWVLCSTVEAVNTVSTGGSSQTIPDPTVQTISDITLTATCTFTFPTAAVGKSFTIILRQPSSGSPWTVNWPGSGAIVWMSGGGAPVLSTVANAVDIVTFVCTDGTHWLGAFTSGYAGSVSDDEWIAAVDCPSQPTTAAVGTWGLSFGLGSGWPDGGFMLTNSSAAQNDAVAWKFPMSAGTWTIQCWVRESTNAGIITVEIDGVSVGTLDTYAASATLTLVKLTGVTIGSSAVHEIRLLMATKNASSSGYVLGIFKLAATRTA